MAKNFTKKSTFGGSGVFDGIEPDTHTHTPTHTQEQKPVVIPTAKERKTRRVQLLLKESTVMALDDYAKAHDTSRNDIIQTLVDDFLNREV